MYILFKSNETGGMSEFRRFEKFSTANLELMNLISQTLKSEMFELFFLYDKGEDIDKKILILRTEMFIP